MTTTDPRIREPGADAYAEAARTLRAAGPSSTPAFFVVAASPTAAAIAATATAHNARAEPICPDR